ncbi:DNA polymerase Y family protein [Devosia sp. A8/3-2]|nr:DNA polymerase Y family protein [Devosia sp. A8/3-2]
MRLAAIDAAAGRAGLSVGQNLADARAMVPGLTVLELDRPLLEAAFADFADWHSNASPLVAVMSDVTVFGDLVLDITGVAHLFGGERAMLRTLLTRLRELGYAVSGAIAPTIGAARAVSHFARSRWWKPPISILRSMACRPPPCDSTRPRLPGLPRWGSKASANCRTRERKPLQAEFGASLLLRLDQACGHIEERMTPRLPPAERYAERRFADPIGLMDDVLMTAHDSAIQLAIRLETEGLGGQAFHLFLYRVDHQVMTLSVNSARLSRDPEHITKLFTHRSERLEGAYDAGFGIDMIRLAVSSVGELDAAQLGVFSQRDVTEDLDQLHDRMSSRLGPMVVLRTQFQASHTPERAARLVPAIAHATNNDGLRPDLVRPLRLLPAPETILINAEVPDGLPASMIWRRISYRLIKASGPERLGAEWWHSGQRLQLVPPVKPKPPASGETPEPAPYTPNLPLFDPDAMTRDYYVAEDEAGRRFWIYRQGFHRDDEPASWYLHGVFS